MRLRRLTHSRFARAFGLMSSATAVGQLAGLLFMPILSRIYTPKAFGEYGVFIAAGATLSVLACMRLDLAIPRAHGEQESESVAAAGVTCAGVVALILLLLVSLVPGSIHGIALSRMGLLLLPASVFVGAVWLVVSQLAIRRGRFREVASRAVLQPIVTFAVQGLCVALDVPVPGLIIGYIAGQSVALLFQSSLRRIFAVGGRRFWSTIRLHRGYILIMTPQGVLNSVNVQLPLLMMSWLYGAETTGYFSMTQRVMGVPIGLVGLTMGQVYVSFLSERKSESPAGVAELFDRVSRVLLVTGLALFVGTVLFSPPLFDLVLGPQWHLSAVFAQVASVMYAAQLVAAPLAVTLAVMRQETKQATWEVCRFGSLLACLCYGWRFDPSPVLFVAVLTVVVSLSYAGLWLLCRRSTMASAMV